MAGPQFQAIGARATSAANTTITPAKPGVSGLGGALIALVSSNNNAVHGTATPGWSLIGQVNSGASFTASLWIAAETAAAPVFTWAGSVACAAQVAYYIAPDAPVDIVVGATTSNNGTTSTHSTASINTTRNDSDVLYIDAADANTALATPAGWTENSDTGSATDVGQFTFGQKQIAVSGSASGAISVTGAAAAWVQWQVELMFDEAGGFETSKVESGVWLDPPDGFLVSKVEVGAWLDDDPRPPPTNVSQAGMYGMFANVPEVRGSQGGIYALAKLKPEVRATQAGIYSLTGITAEVRTSQAGIYLLGSGSPCGTYWAQIWTVTRLDGEVFRFTSKDSDFEYPAGSGIEYQSCDSLVPSASEEVSQLDSAGNMDLSGAIGPDGISEEALYAGLFDGATAEAWLVPWAGEGMPRRLLKGTFGPVEQTKTGYKVELLGDGAKLKQTPLIRLLQPDCRWSFGDDHCQKDLTGLIVTGTVDSGAGQRAFTDAARAETAGYFRRGKVTFTTGLNAGVSAEIKEHETGGVFTLWPRMPFAILAGDQYSMQPGCTNLKEADGGNNGCTAWANLRRYGGFRNVPGSDRRTGAANAKPPGTG